MMTDVIAVVEPMISSVPPINDMEVDTPIPEYQDADSLMKTANFELSTFIESTLLPSSIQKMADQAAPPLITNTTTTPSSSVPSAAVRAETLEIQLRSYLLDLVQAVLSSPTSSSDDINTHQPELELQKAWCWSLLLCAHLVYFSDHQTSPVDESNVNRMYQGMSVRKLPIVLLEDVLDSLPLDQGQRFWERAVEPAVPLLFGPVMWSQQSASWLPFLKVCNKLLRRLRHSHHEAVAVLDDKSSTTPHHQQQQQQPSWAGRMLMLLADVFSLGDKSSHKSWGSFRAVPTEFETQDQFQHQQDPQQQKDDDDDDEEEEDLVDPNTPASTSSPSYTLYETFWSLQQDFSNPSSIKVAMFLQRMRLVLAALESHPITTTAIQAPSKPLRYLTSSNLLPIQLGDLDFRIHFLTQFLIVAHHLASESPKLGTALQELETRAKDLLQRRQPGSFPERGKEHLQLLDFLLQQREPPWRQWKKNKCQPELEKVLPATTYETTATPNDSTLPAPSSQKRKRRRLADTALSEGKQDDDDHNHGMITLEQLACPRQNHSEQSDKTKVKSSPLVPDLETFLEPYVEALDPDAGIEPEYHPKRNAPYCWKAMRLLGQQYLGLFKMVQRDNGDFERVVRCVYEQRGIDVPGVPPEPLKDDDDSDHKDREKNNKITSEDGVGHIQGDNVKSDDTDMAEASAEKANNDLTETTKEELISTEPRAMDLDQDQTDTEQIQIEVGDAAVVLVEIDEISQVTEEGSVRVQEDDVGELQTETDVVNSKGVENSNKADKDLGDVVEKSKDTDKKVPEAKTPAIKQEVKKAGTTSEDLTSPTSKTHANDPKQHSNQNDAKKEETPAAKNVTNDDRSQSSSSKRRRRRSPSGGKRDDSHPRSDANAGSSDKGRRSNSSGDGDGRSAHQQKQQHDTRHNRDHSRSVGSNRGDFKEGQIHRDAPPPTMHGRANFPPMESERPRVPEFRPRGAGEHEQPGFVRRVPPPDERDSSANRGGRSVGSTGPDRGQHRGGGGGGGGGGGYPAEENRRPVIGNQNQAHPPSPQQPLPPPPQDPDVDGGGSGDRQRGGGHRRDDHHRRRDDGRWRRR